MIDHPTPRIGSPPTEPKDSDLPLPVTFEDVRKKEQKQIANSRIKRRVLTPPTSDNLIGLAFSGGGIRSATFNLGILQALAENELLHKFDYLSTVSGGGYIGSWLAATTRRHLESVPGSTFQDVEKALVPGKREPGAREESTFLHWLRLYSNYLTPHTGMLSGDTWAMVGTWTRNVFLNQTVLGLFFLGIFVFCYGVLLGLLKSSRLHAPYLLGFGGFFCFIAAIAMAVNVAEQIPTSKTLKWFDRVKISLTVMLPFLLACLLLNSAFWRYEDIPNYSLLTWIMAGGGFYFLAWTIGTVPVRLYRELWLKKSKEDRMLSLNAFLFSAVLAGGAGGGLCWEYLKLLRGLKGPHSIDWMVAVLGTGVVMLIMLISGALHLGLAGRGCRDLVREWWARLGGYLILLTLAWLFLAGSSAFGPLLVRWILFKLKWASIVPAALWGIHNYLGVRAANSPKTSGKVEKVQSSDTAGWLWISKLFKAQPLLDIIARCAPYVFAIGLILLLSTAVQIGAGLFSDHDDTIALWKLGQPSVTHTVVLNWKFQLVSAVDSTPLSSPANGRTEWQAIIGLYWRVQWAGSFLCLLGTGVGLMIASFLLSSRVDVNDFSLHHFYRNRLVRCYLGASNPERRAQPFTGFDPKDDLPLKNFADDYSGPYPILNAALNITSGSELGYATRRAKSFVFTPLYCGYDLIFPGEGANRFLLDNAYEPSFSETALGRTQDSLTTIGGEDGIALGTAMAISGAAASPNMGYFTSPATGLFMTLFDVRLGWWMGNSRSTPKWKSPGPKLGLGYLFSELFAQSDQEKSYFYLSDGGHFENLAVYELIKRHCKVVVACDADCDGSYEFENLLSLIEKVRTDFGARIEIDFSRIRPRDGRESEQNFVVGDIFYDPRNPADCGKLIFIKTSLPPKVDKIALKKDSLPDDVWRYAEKHLTFPHQSTADQWFDELQFESYRALGEYIGTIAAAEIRQNIAQVL